MEKSGFFNSINKDRVYDAEDWALYIKDYFTTGVFEKGLTVTPGTGMNVKVAPGAANVEGYKYNNTEDLILPISVGDANYTRIDNITIRLDLEERKVSCLVVEGNPSGSPLAPPPNRTANIYDLVPYQIQVPAGSSSITAQMIKDTRFDKNLCGIVTGAVEQIDTTEVFAQYEAYFNEWLEGLKANLDENTAGHLQNEINEIKDNYVICGTCTAEELQAAIYASD